MYYGAIKYPDIANGIGVRVSLFVSGCRNHCEGCFQPETWNFNYGQLFTDDTLDNILNLLENYWVDGLTLLGGDPFEPENEVVLADMCEIIKSKYSDKSIWCYTGYLFEDLLNTNLIKHIDVLVDGKFEIDKKNISLKFRGSENQRIIDVKKSLNTNEIILVKD